MGKVNVLTAYNLGASVAVYGDVGFGGASARVVVARADFVRVGGFSEGGLGGGRRQFLDEDAWVRAGFEDVLGRIRGETGRRRDEGDSGVEESAGTLLGRLWFAAVRDRYGDGDRLRSAYRVRRSTQDSWLHVLLRRQRVLVEVEVLAERRVLSEGAWSAALGRELRDRFGVVGSVAGGMNIRQKEVLLAKFVARYGAMRAEDIALHGEGLEEDLFKFVRFRMPRLIVVHVMHGLGNRLRAMASALAFAEATGREVVVVWERNAHCRAKFSDLFEVETTGEGPDSWQRQLIVIDDFPLSWAQFDGAAYFDDAWREWVAYNYMAREGFGAEKDSPVADDEDKHIYFKSAYVLISKGETKVSWDLANAQLTELRPVKSVRELIAAHSPRADSTVGVHIRSLGLNNEAGIDSVREYGVDDSSVLSFWRSRSQPSNFYAEMNRLLAENPELRFFVASDSAQVLRDVKAIFPGKVDNLERIACDGRDVRCLQLALADMMILGGMRKVLGSPWSSFTEGAQRYGCRNVRQAGIDFAEPTEAEVMETSPAVREVVERVRSKRRKKING